MTCARDVQRLGRQELQRLLHGRSAEQDVLGLVTATRGGLSGPDLAELAGRARPGQAWHQDASPGIPARRGPAGHALS